MTLPDISSIADLKVVTPRGERRRRVLRVGLALAGLALVLTLLTFAADSPPGIDTPGHLFKAWAVAREAENNLFSPLMWTQDWYQGHPLFYYYPPASYFAVGAVDYFTDNIDTSWRIFLFVSIFAGGLTAYILGRLWLTPVMSTLAAFFYVLAPYSMKMIFWEGNLPRTATFALLPLVVYLAVKLVDSGRRRYFVALAVTMAILVLSHHMPGLVTLVLLAVFIPAYSLGRVPLQHVALVAASLGVGLALTTVWLLPAVMNFDLPDTPNLSALPERLGQYSTTASDLLNPKNQLDDFNAKNGYIGLATVIGASMAALSWHRRRLSLALYGAAFVGIIISMGVNLPLYDNFEFLRKWFPERFLQPAVLFLALLAAAGIHSILHTNRLSQSLKIGLAVGLAGLILVDSAPFLRHAMGDGDREREVADAERVGDWLAANGDPERRLFIFSVKDWSTNFAPIQRSGISSTSGWNPEGTPHSRSIGNINAALARGQHGYVLRTLALWDAGYAFIDGEFQPHVALAETMVEEGWRQVNLPFETTLVLYERPDAPGGRVLQNPLNIVTIGEGGRAASVMSPNVGDWSGYSNVIEDQDIDYLAMMDGVLLFGAQSRNRNTSEEVLRPLLEQGITVYEQVSTSAGTRLFGMETERIRFQGSTTIRNAPGAALLPDEGIEIGPFAYQGDLWTAAVITGEGEPLLVAEIGGETHVVAARRRIGSGQFVYIGLSLITQAETNNDPRAAEVVRKLLDFSNSTAMNPVALPVQDLRWNNRNIEFSYSAAQDTPTLISLTYFPGWSAKLDGRPIETFRHERLTLMNLPAGNHQVKLSFGFTGTQRLAAVLSIFALLVLGGLYLPQSRRLSLYVQRTLGEWFSLPPAVVTPEIPQIPGVSLRNGIRFDGAGTGRTRAVELEAGPRRMFLIGGTTVAISIAVRQSGHVVGQFDYSEPGEWFNLGQLDDTVEFDVITTDGHEWSLYLETSSTTTHH